MRKVIALLLALSLCLFAAAALAEEVHIPESADGFDLSVVVPEGYTLGTHTLDDGLSITTFLPDDPDARPELTLVIAFSELYADLSMTDDLTDVQLEDLYDILDDGYLSDGYSMVMTDAGLKYMQIVDNEPNNGYAALVTIHDGYFIETTAAYADSRNLGADDIADAAKLLNSFVLVDLTE